MKFRRIYLTWCIAIVIVLFAITIAGCAGNKPKFDSFKAQSCLQVYCESSENSKSKRAGLALVGIAASVYNIDLDLNRGICEEYYNKRYGADYRYLRVGAEEVCNGE